MFLSRGKMSPKCMRTKVSVEKWDSAILSAESAGRKSLFKVAMCQICSAVFVTTIRNSIASAG